MATLVVGDVQGCYGALQRLLAEARFDVHSDRLWLVGDLVNRGPDSLSVLRFVRELGERAVVTLGNHDLHMLAVALAAQPLKSKDTFGDVFAAADAGVLLDWLRWQPLVYFDASSNTFLSHAGLPHLWRVPDALAYAQEVQAVLRGPEHREFFRVMYGDLPAVWDAGLTGVDRLRVITNYFTRMRWISAAGALEFRHKGELADRPEGYQPWFLRRHADNAGVTLMFGHWAALDGVAAGATNVIALDTGCVWGRRLTAVRLEDGLRFSVAAQPE